MMGILNVTPDSFSDGGLFSGPREAAEHAERLLADGAALVDIGGESTRPGSDPVPAGEEIARVVPVIEALMAKVPQAIVSVDTRKTEVARAALEAGACIVNDVSAASDAGMFDLVRRSGAGLVLMHMLGDPKTMQLDPKYDDVVGEVRGFLALRLAAAEEAGIPRDRLCVDPGIGFGKNLEHNVALLHSIGSFRHLGVPVLVGVSRKRFIGHLTDTADSADEPTARVEGTAGAVAWCASQHIDILRVHDVMAMSRVVAVVDAVARDPA